MIDDIYQKPDLRTFDQIMVDISTISNKCRLIVMTVILVLCHSLLSSDLYVWWKWIVNSQVKLLSSSSQHAFHEQYFHQAWTGCLKEKIIISRRNAIASTSSVLTYAIYAMFAMFFAMYAMFAYFKQEGLGR